MSSNRTQQNTRNSLRVVLFFALGLLGVANSFAGPGPQPPEYVGPTSFSIEEDGEPLELDFEELFDRGPGGGSLIFGVAVQPSPTGIVSGFISGEELVLAGQPDANGQVTLSLQATRVGGGGGGGVVGPGLDPLTTVQEITITVLPTNDAPETAAAFAAVSLLEDQSVVGPTIDPIDLTPGFTDIDVGDSLTFAIDSRTPNTGIVNASISGSSLSLETLPNENGQVTINVRATDSGGALVVSSITVNVSPEQDPPRVVSPTGALTTNEDIAVDPIVLDDVFVDDDGDALSFSIEGVTPTGIVEPSISGGELILPLVANANGFVTVRYRATDPSGAFVEDTLTLDVSPVNDPPEAGPALATVVAMEDQGVLEPIALSPAFIDVDVGDSLSYVIVSRSPNVGIVSGSIVGGALSVETLPTESGTVSFNIRARDSSNATALTTVTVNITPEPDPPRVVNPAGTRTTPEDSPAEIVNLAGVFVDDDGDELSFSILEVTPAGIVEPVLASTDLVLATVENAHGTVTVRYEASDGSETAEDTVTLNVQPVNDPPTVISANNTVTRTEDAPGVQTVDVSAFFDDVDVGDSLTFEILNPDGDDVLASSVINGGAVDFTLIPNAFGSVNLTIQATDSAPVEPPPGPGTATANLTINVTPANDAPFVVFEPADGVGLEDSSVQVSLTGVFDDEDILTANDVLTLSLVSAADTALGSIAIAGDQVVLTPLPNVNGATTVIVQATDSATPALSAEVEFDVVLTPVNDLPFVANPVGPVSFVEDQTDVVISLEGMFDDVDLANEGDTLTLSVLNVSNSSLITQATIIDNDSLVLTLAPNGVGTADIEIQVSDEANATLTDLIQITVTILEPIAQDDSPPAFNENDGFDVDSFPPIEVLANDTLGDPDTIIISAGTSFTLGEPPQLFENRSESEPTEILDATGVSFIEPNATVQIIDGGRAIRYVPKINFSGSDFFTYTIRDADGDVSTARVDVVVTPTNDPPIVPTQPTFELEQASLVSVTAEDGLTRFAFDPEGDELTVEVTEFPPAEFTVTDGFTFTPEGAFQWIPEPGYVGRTFFTVRFSDGELVSEEAVIELSVVAAPPVPDPPVGSEVEFQLDLSNVPLEDAVATEANVLVIMDDSGSMDWDLATNQTSGIWLINNATSRDGVPQRSVFQFYVNGLDSNLFTDRSVLPAAESLDGGGPPGFTSLPNPDFVGNDYGLWRARNSQYNTVYYNPEIDYQPWRGLNPDAVSYPDADPTAALLDPNDPLLTDGSSETIDLTQGHSWESRLVPTTRGVTNGATDGATRVQNVNVYLPHYYTTSVVGRPEADDPNTRVDILPGGTYPGGPARFDCTTDGSTTDTCTYEQEIQNFANWFVYFRNREYTAKAVLGDTIADTSNLRMGYALLNTRNAMDVERIQSLNNSIRTGHKRTLLNRVYQTSPAGGTPLRRALARAGRLFECVGNDSFGDSPSSAPGLPNCPVAAAPEGQCQSNFALLFSDGEWNGNSNGIPSGSRGNHDSNTNNGNAVDTAFDGGVYADNLGTTLADIAMYYYERDLHPELANGVPTLPADLNQAADGSFESSDEVMHQHMKTYTIGFGVTGDVELTNLPSAGIDPDTGDTLVDFTIPFAWGNPFSDGPAKIDDMLHAALNGRGEFLQANNPVVLARAFQEAFDDFSDGSTSISAVAFSSTILRAGTIEYRGFFNLSNNVGDLQAIELIDGVTGQPPINPVVWSAADQLEFIEPNSRVIATFDRLTGEGIPFRFDSLNDAQKDVLTPQELDYARGDRSLEEPDGGFRSRQFILGDIVTSGPQSVDVPRGFLRDRAPFPLNNLYSEFLAANADRRRVVYVGANDGMLHAFDAGQPGATPLDNGTGDELFAYVPNKIIDGSQRFSNRIDTLNSLVYSHRFFVDLTPTVDDVFISPGGLGAQDWRTVLIGGLRGGGKGYFALDITDPTVLASSEANLADAVMWEFTDEDDTYPLDVDGLPLGGALDALTDLDGQPVRDLGFSYSRARIALTNVEGNGSPVQNQWAAIFGNGYNSTAGVATLYALFIDEGQDGWQDGDFIKVSTGNGVIPTNPGGVEDPMAGIPNGLGEPTLIDSDLSGTVDLAYAGDIQGNLYRFEIGDPDPANWQAVRLFTATQDGTLATRRPITVAPFVVPHPNEEGFIVVFGSGSFITVDDGLSTEVESVYGIWDRFEENPATADPDARNTRLVTQTITNLVDETAEFSNLRIMSRNEVDYRPDIGSLPGVYGWVIDLNAQRPEQTLQGNPNPDLSGQGGNLPQFPGERAIRSIVQRGNSLVLTSVVPRDSNSCNRAPPGALWFINSATGGDPGTPVIDLDNDGVIDDGDLVTVDGQTFTAGIFFDASSGGGALVDPAILSGEGDSDFLIVNTSTGDTPETIRIVAPESPKVGRLSWWELLDN